MNVAHNLVQEFARFLREVDFRCFYGVSLLQLRQALYHDADHDREDGHTDHQLDQSESVRQNFLFVRAHRLHFPISSQLPPTVRKVTGIAKYKPLLPVVVNCRAEAVIKRVLFAETVITFQRTS